MPPGIRAWKRPNMNTFTCTPIPPITTAEGWRARFVPRRKPTAAEAAEHADDKSLSDPEHAYTCRVVAWVICDVVHEWINEKGGAESETSRQVCGVVYDPTREELRIAEDHQGEHDGFFDGYFHRDDDDLDPGNQEGTVPRQVADATRTARRPWDRRKRGRKAPGGQPRAAGRGLSKVG
jgi:hypothetical protein